MAFWLSLLIRTGNSLSRVQHYLKESDENENPLRNNSLGGDRGATITLAANYGAASLLTLVAGNDRIRPEVVLRATNRLPVGQTNSERGVL